MEDTDHTKPSRTDVCVFSCEATPEKIGSFYEVGHSYLYVAICICVCKNIIFETVNFADYAVKPSL